MSRELLGQALDALIYHTNQTRPIERTDTAITALRAALAQPEPIDGFGGNLDEAFERAPAVPVSWDRLRILMDGIPTREEFIGGQRQKYVAKEAVMSWLHEGQLRAEREAAQPAAPAVQVVLRQPNLFAPAPAVPLTEEWIAQFSMDVPLAFEQVEKIVRHVEQAHGIGGGGK